MTIEQFFTSEFLSAVEPWIGDIKLDFIFYFTFFFITFSILISTMVTISYLFECLIFGLNYKYSFWKRKSSIDRYIDFFFEILRTFGIFFLTIKLCTFCFRLDPLYGSMPLTCFALFFYAFFCSFPWHDWYKEVELFLNEWKETKDRFKNIKLKERNKENT